MHSHASPQQTRYACTAWVESTILTAGHLLVFVQYMGSRLSPGPEVLTAAGLRSRSSSQALHHLVMYLHTASCISVQPVLVCPCVLTSLLPVVCCQVGLTGMPAKQATDPRKPARHVRTGKSCCSVTTEGLIKETHLRMRSSTLMASSSRFSLSCSAASLNRAAVSSSSSCSSAASSPCKWRYADVSLIVCGVLQS